MGERMARGRGRVIHKPLVMHAYERKVGKYLRQYAKTVEKETRRIHRIMQKYWRPNVTTKRSSR